MTEAETGLRGPNAQTGLRGPNAQPGLRGPNAMTAQLIVRAALPEEHEAVAELTVATYGDILGKDLTDDYRVELRDVRRRAEEAVVLVAVDGSNRLLGSVTYVPGLGPYAEFEGADEAGIRMLVVAPAVQGRGVGSALVQRCVELARAAGKARVGLHTTGSMLTAQRLYQRLGFRRAPERDLVVADGLLLMGYVLEL